LSNFNVFERQVAKLLSRTPGLKKSLKLFYSRLAFLRHRKNYRKRAVREPFPYRSGAKETFFGYFDKSPVNQNGYVLVYTTEEDTSKAPLPQGEVVLNVHDSKNQEVVLSITVRAFNWQQGSRAHWLDDDLFIFNDFDEASASYVAKVWSLKGEKQVKTFTLPVQDSFGVEYFISLDYQRLQALRPDYGYQNLPPMNQAELEKLENDGLWLVDFATGSSRLFISLSDLKSFQFKPEMENAHHKVNHVMISPSGRQFIFMHRFRNGGARTDRLFLADVENGQLRLLADFGMVSHCFWANEESVFGYLRGPGNKEGYWLVNVDTGDFTSFGAGKLDRYGDGHPHVWGDWFVTDTYPDKSRMQHLILGNFKTGEVREIGEFFHGFEYDGESRCDLHPRFSLDGKSVFFDSVFSGKRQLYKMDLD